MLAPLDHQRCAAAFAFLLCRLFHPLDVLHMLFGITEILDKFLVEIAQRVSPLLLAFFDFVQLFFQTRGVLDIENVGKVLYQKISHDQPDFRRHEFAA